MRSRLVVNQLFALKWDMIRALYFDAIWDIEKACDALHPDPEFYKRVVGDGAQGAETWRRWVMARFTDVDCSLRGTNAAPMETFWDRHLWIKSFGWLLFLVLFSSVYFHPAVGVTFVVLWLTYWVRFDRTRWEADKQVFVDRFLAIVAQFERQTDLKRPDNVTL